MQFIVFWRAILLTNLISISRLMQLLWPLSESSFQTNKEEPFCYVSLLVDLSSPEASTHTVKLTQRINNVVKSYKKHYSAHSQTTDLFQRLRFARIDESEYFDLWFVRFNSTPICFLNFKQCSAHE